MSITNFSELQSALSTWSHRADVSAVVSDFITMAEARFNRELRVPQMEASTAISVADPVPLPSDFLEARRVYIDTTPYRVLDFLSPDYYYKKNNTSTSGIPSWFTIEGSNMKIGPTPDSSYTVNLTYYQKIPDLATNSTNWLLTAHPDLYLHASLKELYIYTKDVDSAIKEDMITADLIQKVISSGKGSWSGNSLRVVAA